MPVSFDKYAPVPNTAANRKERGQEVDINQGQTSTAINAAKLPYAGQEAEASVANLLLRNTDLQRQLDKARKGEPLTGDDKTKFETDVDAFARLDKAINTYNPDFSGTVLDFPGNVENALQRNVSSSIGTKGQAAFWQEMHLLDMMVRNKYFGASLTPAEKASYAETTITPGMTPELSLQNLMSRRETLSKAIQRRVNSLRAGGYNPAQINAALGDYVPVLNPRWMSAENERALGEYASSKDYDPEVYKQMLLQFGDANGLRLDPAGADAAAGVVAEKRAKGETKFGGPAVYQGLEEPKEEPKRDENGAIIGANAPTDDGDGLGWGETLGSAAVNFVPDVVNELSGIADAVLHPINTATSVAQLGGGVLSMLGVGDFDQSTARALGKYYSDKYGSIEGFKKELAEHPASILGDVAMVFSGGAGAAAKLGIPAKLAAGVARMGPRAVKVAEFAATAAKNVDPITALTNIVTKAAPAAIKGAGKVANKVAAGTLGATTGVGSDAFREAARVGFDRSVAGAPTSAADAFLTAMRNPAASADEVVQLARDAIGNLRQQASQRYTDTMSRFGRNPVPLDISKVRQRIARIKPDSYDTWRDSQGPRPSSHRAWETMNEFVDEYAYKATQDPSLLTPLAMDQFKQDLYDVGSKVGGAYDRDAARIAGTAYGAVKDELVKHDPIYADAMKDYENAAKEAQQLESTFSLAAARGKQPNIESAGRKLSASLRNNVNTNFGTRTAQAERLAELDPTGRLMPSLAGQSLNAELPRGLSRGVASGLASSGVAGMALDMIPMAMDVPGYLSGANLAMLPAMSPRLMGEAAYYAGRGAGAASKALEPVTSRIGNGMDWLAQKQEQYRTPFMTAGVAGMGLEAMQDPDLQAMVQQYAEQPQEQPAPRPAPQPAAAVEAAPKAQVIRIPGANGEIHELVYDENTDTYLEPKTGRRVKNTEDITRPPPAVMYRGGLMALANRYR